MVCEGKKGREGKESKDCKTFVRRDFGFEYNPKGPLFICRIRLISRAVDSFTHG